MLIIVGSALRVWRAFVGLPMRIDEIRVAVNIEARGYGGLAQPLDHQQGAPVGFLWLVETVVNLFGSVDWAYRLVPLLAGIGTMVIVPFLARQVVGRPGVVIATALAALSPWAIQYSSDLKQYSLDAMATGGVLFAAVVALSPRATWKSRLAFALVGATALFCSHSAMFVTAGTGLTLGIGALCRRQWREAGQLVGVAVFWGAALALLWWVNLRHISGRDDLMDYWDQDFMPLPPRTAAEWGWYARAPMEWLNTSGYYFNPVVLVFVFFGLFALRRHKRLAGLLLAPVGLTLAASAAGEYPFANRMIAFLMPATILLLAVGFDWVMHTARWVGRVSNAIQPKFKLLYRQVPELIALGLAVLSFVVTLPFSQINQPWMGGRFDVVRPMRDIQQNRQADEPIVLGNALWWSYISWYAPRMGMPHDPGKPGFLNQRMPRDPADEYADQLRDNLAGYDRAWVLAADGIWMGHHPKWPTLGDMHDTRATTRAVLEQLGTIKASYDYANVTAYYYVNRSSNESQVSE
ncbi:MAG: glycosyltransferase family 39 protein [Planctomycetota bacterium]